MHYPTTSDPLIKQISKIPRVKDKIDPPTRVDPDEKYKEGY